MKLVYAHFPPQKFQGLFQKFRPKFFFFSRQFTLHFTTMHGRTISRFWWIPISQTWEKSQERWNRYWSCTWCKWRWGDDDRSGFISQKKILSQKINPITSHQRTCFTCDGNFGQKVSPIINMTHWVKIFKNVSMNFTHCNINNIFVPKNNNL